MSKSVPELVDNAAEAGTIASLICHPEYLLTDNNLQPRFFWNYENQFLFWAISKLVSNGVTKIDALNLHNILYTIPGFHEFAKKHGLLNLQEYIEMATFAARGSYDEYKLLANRVLSLAFRRELNNLSIEIGNECYNQEISLDDLNDYVNNGITKIAEKFIFGSDSVQFGEKIDSIWREICEARNDDGSIGIPNLIPSLDEFFTFGKGELVLVAGATGRGKSSYFMNQGLYALKHGVPIVIIDTELVDKTYLPRVLACLSGVAVKKIKNGRYTNEEGLRIQKAMEFIKRSPGFVHEYQPIFNRTVIEQIFRKWSNKNQLGFGIYDYIKPTERYGAAEISQSLGLMTDFLKSIAGTLEIPILAGLQLNKLTGTVSDSQKPERYADVLMYWKDKSVEQLKTDGVECGNYYMQVIKNRNGSIHDSEDYVDVQFIGDLMNIKEAKKHTKPPDTPFDQAAN